MARVVQLPQTPVKERRPDLVLVPPIRRKPRNRRLRRALIFVVVLVLMGLVVIARIAIESEESTIGLLRADITQAQHTQSDLKLKVAELSAPQRIMSYASQHLHLSLPGSVNVVAGGTTKGAVALPQSEARNPTLPLPAGEVQSGN